MSSCQRTYLDQSPQSFLASSHQSYAASSLQSRRAFTVGLCYGVLQLHAALSRDVCAHDQNHTWLGVLFIRDCKSDACLSFRNFGLWWNITSDTGQQVMVKCGGAKLLLGLYAPINHLRTDRDDFSSSFQKTPGLFLQSRTFGTPCISLQFKNIWTRSRL